MRILLVFLVLVCVRGACSFRQAWFEGDDIVIAAGVAALINDNCGDDYRYSVQPGYYRLVEGIVRGMGGDIGLVPEVMFALSAIAGAWLVALGLLAFPKQLGTRERWVLSAVLLANPILWVSSQYGNTGLLSCALGTSAVVWLSRSPGRIGEACALLLWGCATLVRNDAVLLVGAIAWLLWRRHGLKGMVGRGAVLGVVMGAVLGAMIAFDPRMQNPLVAVGDHVLNDDVRTHFFKYLLWAMSPLPLVFALVGTGQLIHRRDSLLPALFLWMLPVGAFYFGSTTTPRYFLLMAFPLSMLTALGAVGLHRRLWGGRSRSVAAAIAVLLGLHLVVALGHFKSSKGWRGVLGDASFATDDGPMPTGWLLRQGLRNLRRRIEEPKFLGANGFAREVDAELARLQEGGGPARIFFVLGGFPTVSFHFHAQKAGCRYVSREDGQAFGMETRLVAGDTTVITVADGWGSFDKFETLPLAAGDRIWISFDIAHDKVLAKLPDGLGVRSEPDLASPLVVRYELVRK